MIKRDIFVVCCSLILISQNAFAQSSTGSAYNAYGFGRIYETGLGSFMSSGNAAIGVRSVGFVNLKNPASLNAIQGPNQIFDFDIALKSFSQQTSDESGHTMLGGVQNINMWFKPNDKFAFTFGSNVFSEAKYDITDLTEYSPLIDFYSVRYRGSGGLSKLYLAGSYLLGNNLSLGARANLLVGHIDKTTSISNNAIMGDVSISHNYTFIKLVPDFGAQYTLPVSADRNLSIGLTYRPGMQLQARFKEDIIKQNSDTLSSSGYESFHLPSLMGVGVSSNIGDWVVSADFEFENWNVLNDAENSGVRYLDQYKVSVGAEYLKDSYSMNYVERMIFRVGASLNNYYVEIKDTKMFQVRLSGGVGLPIQRGGGYLNLGYQYERLGTKTNGLILEHLHTFTLNTSLRDIWFVKRVYE